MHIRPQQGNFLFLIQEVIKILCERALQLQNTAMVLPSLPCVSSARKQEDSSLENVSMLRRTYFCIFIPFFLYQ